MNKKRSFETVAELAERTGMTDGTIRDWARRGIIPALKPSGKNLLFHRESVDAALQSKMVQPAKVEVER